MESHFPYTSFKLEQQMIDFTPEQQKLVREVALASRLQAQKIIDEIKRRKKDGMSQMLPSQGE